MEVDNQINKRELYKLLDHQQLIHWIEFMAYKVAQVGYTNTNFDGRPFIVLPSGQKIVITIKIESYFKENKMEDIESTHAFTG